MSSRNSRRDEPKMAVSTSPCSTTPAMSRNTATSVGSSMPRAGAPAPVEIGVADDTARRSVEVALHRPHPPKVILGPDESEHLRVERRKRLDVRIGDRRSRESRIGRDLERGPRRGEPVFLRDRNHPLGCVKPGRRSLERLDHRRQRHPRPRSAAAGEAARARGPALALSFGRRGTPRTTKSPAAPSMRRRRRLWRPARSVRRPGPSRRSAATA